jgi:hypothetical protein
MKIPFSLGNLVLALLEPCTMENGEELMQLLSISRKVDSHADLVSKKY